MSESGGQWVTVQPPGAPPRQDWIPDEQPDSPDGSPGRWHVVGQPGEQGRWEWVHTDDPILETVGAGRSGQESMMAPPGSYGSPSPSSYYAPPAATPPPPEPAAQRKPGSVQLSLGSLGPTVQVWVKRVRTERRLWAPVGLGVFLVLVLLWLVLIHHHKAARPAVPVVPMHPAAAPAVPAAPKPQLGAAQVAGVPATHVPVQAGDWRLDRLTIDKDPTGPDFVAHGTVTWTGTGSAPAGQFTILVYKGSTQSATLHGTSKAAATAAAPAAGGIAGAPPAAAAPPATPTPVEFTSSDAFQNGADGFTFRSGA